MVGSLSESEWPAVGEFVEAFEAALARDGRAELADFAPPPDHPGRLAIVCELVRVDLEYHWQRPHRRQLEQYRDRFPDLFANPELVHAMAFEEYRLRLQAGERPTPDDYQRRFGVEDHRDWPSWPAEPDPGKVRSSSHGWPPVDAPVRDDAFASGSAASADRSLARKRTREPDAIGFLLESKSVAPEHAELLRDLSRTDPHTAERLAEAFASLPPVGGRFLGFRLCAELGRGAFGRVYLARQGDLANRLVALKVSADVSGETHVLAQLQHTNVVPVYSVHRSGPLQAVCMPYLGATTLADTLADLKRQAKMPDSGEGLLSTRLARKSAGVGSGIPSANASLDSRRPALDSFAEDVGAGPEPHVTPPTTPQVERLRGLGYVPAVLWLVARVADGLAHAHERGILHRDLKPANILFADDGEPLLLDFNLAADTKLRVHLSAALVGGTLPYMAPEHLDAFRDGDSTVDARSDVYSLGVILYELLTGHHPFPIRRGAVDDIVPSLIADRLGAIPDPRRVNPSVSPAVASIVAFCLAAEPARRYQSARELQRDLQCQLDDRPLQYAPEPSVRERLRKWTRRHPRLTSSTTVGLVGAVLLLTVASTFLARHRYYQQVEAADSFSRLSGEAREAMALLSSPDADSSQIDEGIARCRDTLGRYHVLDDPAWPIAPLVASLPPGDRARLHKDLGELLVLWSRALAWRAASRFGQARAKSIVEAKTLLARAEACYGSDAVPRALVLVQADLARLEGRDQESQRLRTRAETIPLRTPRERLLTLSDRLELGHRREILEFVGAVAKHEPDNFANWVLLGNCQVRFGNVKAALNSYAIGIALAPGNSWPYFNRGALFLASDDNEQAVADFDRVIALRPDRAYGYLNRALAKLDLGDAQGALDDLNRCLEKKDAPARALFIRAKARDRLGDREGSRRDREEGLARQPDDEASWVSRGLARLPADPQAALADFDAALALNPTYPKALENKASVLEASLGRPEDAIKALDTAILHHPGYVKAVAGRGVLLARLGRRDLALRDARAALALDERPLNLYQNAGTYALTSTQEPGDRAESLRLLARALKEDGSWLRVFPKDHDFDAVRDRPEFRELLRAMAVVHRDVTSRQRPNAGGAP